MLKFYVMLTCILCYSQLTWSAPVIKASGIQWTEPKGNGKGNLTIMMIPQSNSCSNDSDMLVAVKSDYQVVSQDTQLLNLVVNEYQKDTCNKNSVSGLQASNVNGINNQVSGYNTNSTAIEEGQSHAVEHQQSSQVNLPKSNNEKQNMVDQKDIGGVDTLTYTTVVGRVEEGGNQGFDSGAAIQNEQQNNGVNGSPVLTNENSFIEVTVSKDISKDGQIYQAADDLNMNAGIGNSISNSNQNSRAFGDFLKYISSISDPGQPNNAKYYEVEKKTVEKIKTNPENQDVKIDNENQSNANAPDVFKFLNALHVEGTTSIAKMSLGILSSAKMEPNQMTTLGIKELKSMSSNATLASIDHDSLVSSKTWNKNPRANIFNDKEINIFKLLNVSEPNNKLKIKEKERAISDVSPKHGNYGGTFLNELLRNSKLKQLHAGESNLRPDSLLENQPEEFVALDESEFDTKLKRSRGAYFAPASASDEEISKYQVDFPNSYRVGEFKLEENGNAASKSGSPTTCATVTMQTTSGNQNGGINGDSSQRSGTDTQSSSGATQNVTGEKDSDKVGKDQSILPTPNSQNGSETGVSDSSAPDATNSMQTSTIIPSTAPSSCRTSIVYICDSVSNNSGNKGGSQQKITLRPTIDCAAYLRTKQLSGAVTNSPIQNLNLKESENLQENANFKENEVFPFMVKLKNKNYISESKKNPIMLKNFSLHNKDDSLHIRDKTFGKMYTHIPDTKINEIDSPERQKIVRLKSNNKEQNVPIININSLDSDKVVHPGQTLNLRFVGKKMFLEQMPSFRSEKLDSNKNCDPKQTTEPSSDEMDPDENDKDGKSNTKSRKSKPSGNLKTTEQNSDYEGTGLERTSGPEVKGSTILPIPGQTEIQEDKKSKLNPPENSQSKEQNSNNERTKGTSGPEGKENTVSPIPRQSESQSDKNSKNQEKGSKYVTECKSAGNGSPTNSKISSNRGGLKLNSDSMMTSLKKKGSISTQSYEDSLEIKNLRTTGSPSGNIKIPGDSVKEIVIQIIRHTNSPIITKSDSRFAAVDLSQDEPNEKEMTVQKSCPPLKKFHGEKIKPGGYEMEVSNMENKNQQKINYLNPINDLENQDANIDSNHFYPSSNRKSVFLDKFYLGKESNEDFTPAVSNANAAGNEKYDKALSYSDFKLLVDNNNNNIIYGG